MRSIKSLFIFELIMVAPALLIGMIAMKNYGVASNIYLQNAVVFFIGLIISGIILNRNIQSSRLNFLLLILLITIIMALTLIFSDVDGVHRWISVGPISLHLASIFLPLLIILIWNQFEKGRMTLVVILAMAILLILFIQPDASQLTAFGLPIIVIFYKKLKPLSLFIICSIFVTIMIAISWILLDSLAPVEYVEDIMLVVKDMGLIWLFLGILSLIMMIMPFIVFSDKKYCLLSRLIGLYFAITIISTYFGNFPMPIMGYGVSPVIGYQVAITWLFKTRLKI